VSDKFDRLLERFFDKTGENVHMSQQAFSEARQKIKWEAFREMFDHTVKTSYTDEIERWNGFRLFAIDGSTQSLPNDPKLRAHFGTCGAGNTSPTAQGSILYDILNDVVVDARIEPMATGERALARMHITHLQGLASFEPWKELIIFDRGYASKELINELLSKNIRFVMRVRTKFSTEIDALERGDHTITLGHGDEQILLRVLKFRLSSGEVETLITDLQDAKFGLKTFKALYFKRWPIETKYGALKKSLG
jgi:hypothetical protein